jgi:DNA-damage-inducible protein J
MNSTVINIKTDIKVKKEAQRVVADLGLSLSGAINGFLKQLIRNKAVLFTLNEGVPSDYLLSSIKESKNERKSGNFHSFKNNQAAISFLDNK